MPPVRPLRASAVLLAALMLAACQAADGPRLETDSGRPTVAAPPEATQPSVPAIPASQAIFRFDSVLGVPTNKADVLSTALGRYARARSLTLVRRGDPTATYRVIGFLSAVGGTGGTSVSYVWDILDAEGRRVHRITGAELAGEATADPWSGVNDKVLDAVAARSIEGINAWINQAPGSGAVALQPGAKAI